MSLFELAERCEQAAGPDRELDVAVAIAVHWPPLGNVKHWVNDWEAGLIATDNEGYVGLKPDPELDGPVRTQWEVPTYTASLDATMTLVPEGWSVTLFIASKQHTTRCTLAGDGETIDASEQIVAISRQPSTALCAAALKARAASGMEAATAGETGNTGSTEGDSPTLEEGDAQGQSHD